MSSAAPINNRAPWLVLGAGLALGLVSGLLIFVGAPLWPPAGATVPGAKGTPAPAPVMGAPAPDFTTTDLRGNTVTLSSLQGQVVLLNFWATWCVPCRLEMPALQKAYDNLNEKGFAVLAVNLDEPVADIRTFLTELDLNLTVLLDPGAKINDQYRVRGYPTTFFIDRDGYIAREHIGEMSEKQLNDYLAKLGLTN